MRRTLYVLALTASLAATSSPAGAAPLTEHAARAAAVQFADDLGQEHYMHWQGADASSYPAWEAGSPFPDGWASEVGSARRVSRAAVEFDAAVKEFWNDAEWDIAAQELHADGARLNAIAYITIRVRRQRGAYAWVPHCGPELCPRTEIVSRVVGGVPWQPLGSA